MPRDADDAGNIVNPSDVGSTGVPSVRDNSGSMSQGRNTNEHRKRLSVPTRYARAIAMDVVAMMDS
jgi:hypothetical protein